MDGARNVRENFLIQGQLTNLDDEFKTWEDVFEAELVSIGKGEVV